MSENTQDELITLAEVAVAFLAAVVLIVTAFVVGAWTA